MTKKAENYTPEMTATITAAYTAAETDEGRKEAVSQMAERFGKTVASVRMKLVREGVYRKPIATDKTGAPVEKKEALVDRITKSVPMSEGDASSLAKANKRALVLIAKALEERDEEEEEND